MADPMIEAGKCGACGAAEGGGAGWNEWREKNPAILVDLIEANLQEVELSGANLVGADLSDANLGNANLRGLKLGGSRLVRADLVNADLRGTYLSKAHLDSARLIGADLSDADLSGVHLDFADLHSANLSNVDLRGSRLVGTNLMSARLKGADLTNTCLQAAILANTDLCEVKGLEKCQHLGPSIVDHHTLIRSGALPETFLRGCGWPDVLIATVPALLNDPIQYYSCFISYSSKDHDFASRLHADLQDHGVRCWFAPHDAQGGKKLHEQLDQAIRVYDKLLLVLSENSMASTWVEFELRRARRRERQNRQRLLFPIRLSSMEALQEWECVDSDEGRDLAAEVREYIIPDFSNWKDHDAYQAAFERLLRDLRAEDAASEA